MKLAIIGKGALGLLYGNMAQEHLGPESVFFVMDDERFEKHQGDTFTINGKECSFTDVKASEAEPVDAVMIAVKSTGLQQALDLVEPLLGPDTVIIPVLNGITSEEKTAARYGWERTIACVAYGMDAARFGTSLEFTQPGELVLGCLNDATPQRSLDKACAVLDAAGIAHTIADDIRHRQWAKFMANTGVNQACAVFGMTYSELFADETSEEFRTYIGAMREVIAVSGPEGVNLTEQDMNDYIAILHTLDPNSQPSMAQDRINKNPSEVDEFSGEIIRLGAKHGIVVPCNQFFNDRMREIEAAY